MAERWIFTKEQLQNTPSRKAGIDYAKELAYRQQAANLIQDMGQRLQVNQLCINTSIVYMHRFYMFQSFTRFHRNVIAPACLFLAAKVEEQLRKLEHVIKVARSCINRDAPPLDTKTEAYLELAQELVVNENILLQSLGFDIQVDHPHTHVVKTCQLVRASKDLAQTSYFLATNSLHLTTMCLQYKPTVVACVCIDLASKWSEYEIAVSHEGKPWYSYVDQSVTPELLSELTQEFLNILDSCPLKLKRKILTWKSKPEDDAGGPPPEKRHKVEAGGSGGASSSHHSSTGHDRHSDPNRADRKSESASKMHRSETISSSAVAARAEMVKAEQDPNVHRKSHTQPVPNPVKKSSSDSSGLSGRQSGQTSTQSSSSADSVDALKRPPGPHGHPRLSVKEYQIYKEKQAATAAAASGTPNLPNHQPDREQRMHSQSTMGDIHRKHKHQHGSSSSGDEKKIKREHERKSSQPSEENRHVEESLKVHIKKERSDEPLKVHIRKESGTHKIKPTGSPLKLTIKNLSGSESSPSKSEKHSEHKPDSLKMKFSLKPGQSSGHGERPSKHRRSEGYSSSGNNPDPDVSRSSKHGYSRSSGVDGNGIHDPTRSNRHSNSHHKSAEQHSKSGHEGKMQQANLSFTAERGASGSIFSPPPVHLNFDANIFDKGAQLLSQTTGSHGSSSSVAKPGYGAYPQGNMSSNYSDSFSSFLPDMLNLGELGQNFHGLETNGSGMPQPDMPTPEDQQRHNMQQLLDRSKSHIAQQMLHQQQQQQIAAYGMPSFLGIPSFQTNPPLPSVPPPPPPPPEDPPQPPPPPPN